LSKIKSFLTVLAVSALVVPAGAMAGKPTDPGSKGKNKSVPAKCKHVQKVGFTITGVVRDAAAEPAAGETVINITHDGQLIPLSVKVEKSNSHVKKYFKAGGSTDFEVAAIKLGEGNAAADTGDRVKVVGKVTRYKKGCAGTQTVTLKKVTVSSPEPAEAPAT
jgi:hypothetical protein